MSEHSPGAMQLTTPSIFSAVIGQLGSVVSTAISDAVLSGGCLFVAWLAVLAFRHAPGMDAELQRALVKFGFLYVLVIPVSALARLVWVVRTTVQARHAGAG